MCLAGHFIAKGEDYGRKNAKIVFGGNFATYGPIYFKYRQLSNSVGNGHLWFAVLRAADIFVKTFSHLAAV